MIRPVEMEMKSESKSEGREERKRKSVVLYGKGEKRK